MTEKVILVGTEVSKSGTGLSITATIELIDNSRRLSVTFSDRPKYSYILDAHRIVDAILLLDKEEA